MKKFKHISYFENILNEQIEIIEKVNKLLNKIKSSQKEYKKLTKYYYSEQRDDDLIADEKGEIPPSIKRGVLSEDGIYNLITDYQQTAIEMLEVATAMIKIW
ncbi:MAG: DUF4298 domain-containing protein [Treponemataceae bacterium]